MRVGNFVLLIENQGQAGEQYETPSYLNVGGTGNRQAIMTVSGSGATLWGVIETEGRFVYWIDGNKTNGAGGYPNNAVAVAGEWVQFDFGAKKLITEMKMYWNAAATPTGVWKCQGWTGSAWEDVGSSFTLGTSLTQTIDLSSNTKGYTKYRWLGVSGVTDWNCYNWDEVEFKIASLLGGGGGEGIFYFSAFGSSLVAGNEASKLRDKIALMNPSYSISYNNQSVDGNWSWSNLVRYPAGVGTMLGGDLIMCDNRSVNAGREQKSLEAMYRKVRTDFPTAAIVAGIYPVTLDPLTDVVEALTAQETADQALAAAYGVHLVNYRQEVINRVAGGEPLTNYIGVGEQIHPSETGKDLLVDMIYTAAVQGGWLEGETPPALPTATYDTDGYYTDTTPQRANGNTGVETGTGWENVGTAGRESSTAGDTITFTKTCRSFGLYSAGTANTTCDVQVDGGAWQTDVAVTHNGQYFDDLSDAEHTITIRVRTGVPVRIDEFWAI